MKFPKPQEAEEFNKDDLKEMLSTMVSLGLLKIAGYTDSFEPQYSVTPLGLLELELHKANDI